jgi:hypothetical protein
VFTDAVLSLSIILNPFIRARFSGVGHMILEVLVKLVMLLAHSIVAGGSDHAMRRLQTRLPRILGTHRRQRNQLL